MAREAIGLALATEETHARFHGNGARPGGILTSELPLKDDQVNRLREAWQQTQGGVANAMKTAILSGGLKYQQLMMTGVDAQHIETRKFQIEEVCRAFRVFPAMVGYSDKTATYASAEAFFAAHVRHSLLPWGERFEQATDRDCLSAAEIADGYYTALDYRQLLRGDAASRAAFYASGITNGWMTRNEARAEEDLNPLEGLDEPLKPLNMGGGNDAAGNDQPAAATSQPRTKMTSPTSRRQGFGGQGRPGAVGRQRRPHRPGTRPPRHRAGATAASRGARWIDLILPWPS